MKQKVYDMFYDCINCTHNKSNYFGIPKRKGFLR